MKKVLKAMGEWLPVDLRSWDNFLPPKEKQKKYGFDTMSCVSQAIVNIFEALFNYLYKKDKIKGQPLQFLLDNGYFIDGHIQFSKRAIAKLSDTSKEGNYGSKVFDTVLKYGLMPESKWPWETADEWTEYYEDVSQEVIDIGGEFNKYFGLGGGWVARQNFNLRRSMIAGAVFAWIQNERKYGKLYYKPDNVNRNHFVSLIKTLPTGNDKIFDSYDPFIKTLHESNNLLAGYYGKVLIKYDMKDEIQKLLEENDQGTIVNSDTQETGYVLRNKVIVLKTVQDKVDALIDQKNRGVITKSAEYVNQSMWDELPKVTFKQFRDG